MASNFAKVAGLSAVAVLLGLSAPYLRTISPPHLTSFIGDFPIPDYPFAFPFLRNETALTSQDGTPFVCDTLHSYRTELVSLDPLIIYIHDLITPKEIESLLETAETRFAPSQVTKQGRQQNTNDRTSESAGLPREDPTVQCVLNRARRFMGTMLRDGWDEMGPPQLVRYTTGQRFNVHHDWFNYPLWATDGTDRQWNRVASFFAILHDNCTGGETHFPYARSILPRSPKGELPWGGSKENQIIKAVPQDHVRPLWREHEDGGLAFRPVAGNAIFWINLHPNGTGDERTNHAGLPLESGKKTAMNIWPRRYWAYE